MTRAFDPIGLEVAEHRFAGLAEEMGEALVRSALSPNIKERRDLSCAVFDRDGDLVAHAAHIPVHLGAMPASVAHALAARPPERGDVVVLNDPYRGGTHLPDITLVAPVFLPGDTVRPSFYVANRAHHADVGGMSSGSMTISKEIFQEGLIIPPVRLARDGRIAEDVLDLILANVRNPDERRWDLTAQCAVLDLGSTRLLELAGDLGEAALRAMATDLIAYAESAMRATIAALPDGESSAADVLEPIDDTTPVIRASIRISGDEARIDFGGTDPVVAAPINAVRAVTASAVCYVFRCLLDEPAPANAGIMRPVTLVTEPGSLVDATSPAAVAAGNVETSQRIVDVLLHALAGIAPARVPAASAGTMMNVAIGSTGGASPITYYETIAGGAGATATVPGAAAIQTHMTNTRNTPVEAIAHEFPFRVVQYGVRRDSGGRGRMRGGDGVSRVLEARAVLDVSVLSERRVSRPYGLDGGGDGRSSMVTVERADGIVESLPPRAALRLAPGDRLRIETPGGGGHGLYVEKEDDK